MQEVRIQKLSRGLFITVGCKTIAVNEADMAEAMANITAYVTGTEKNASEMHQKFFPEDFGNAGGICERAEPPDRSMTAEEVRRRRTPPAPPLRSEVAGERTYDDPAQAEEVRF